jgi:sortase A
MPNLLDLDQAAPTVPAPTVPAPTVSVSPLPELTKPGIHSYNWQRRATDKLEPPPPQRRQLPWVRLICLFIGVVCIGYYGFTLADNYVYQRYQNWAFDQQISGRHVTLKSWLMETTPLGKWFGYTPPPAQPGPAAREKNDTIPNPGVPKPAYGSIIGRVAIPRLSLQAVVREGADEETLRRAVGHVPSTQLPGDIGNFAIAAHRDTLFRGLKDIKVGDRVRFESPQGTFDYTVLSTKIVRPSDVSVLDPQGDQKLLTMITCYPFYYVGSAPKRFIVTARLENANVASSPPATTSSLASSSVSPPVVRPSARVTRTHHPTHVKRTVTELRHQRSFSHTKPLSTRKSKSRQSARKRGVWNKLNPFRSH